MPRRLTIADFLLRAVHIHGSGTYDYSLVREYKNNTTKLKIICKVPGHGVFPKSAKDHINRKQGCTRCAIERANAARKITYDQFVSRSNETHNGKYYYSPSDYTGWREKVSIFCAQHSWFSQQAEAHARGNGCSRCGDERKGAEKIVTYNEFVERSHKAHHGKYYYSPADYMGLQFSVSIFCLHHGWFSQRANGHVRGHGCSKCGNEIRNQGNRISYSEFVTRANNKHHGRYYYSPANYVAFSEKTSIFCKDHGWFSQRAEDHARQQGCPGCANKSRNSYKKITYNEFVSRSNEAHHGKYYYSPTNYGEWTEKVAIFCPDHSWFSQEAHAHATGQGCPTCNESKGEKYIRQFLLKHNLDFETQKTFPDCMGNGLPLRFDFYLTRQNLLIEFDGIQHFQTVRGDFFGGQKALEERQKRDEIKDFWMWNNPIRLIRIPYTALSDGSIEEILRKALNIQDAA